MTKHVKLEPHGFNVAEANKRLEDWFLEDVPAPVRAGLTRAERTAAIRRIAMDYWASHMQWHSIDDKRQVQRLGVALALLEICAHEEALREMHDAEMARQAEPHSLTRALADEIAASPLSRAVMNQTGGRPKNLLADAVAQQLRAFGFTHQAIAEFMGSTEGATRWRCNANEARSLANLLGAYP